MDIREVSEEEKKIYIDRVVATFDDLRNVLATLEIDMVSPDLMTQASAVWIGGNLTAWYHDFMTQIREIDKSRKALNDIQEDIKEIAEDKPFGLDMAMLAERN